MTNFDQTKSAQAAALKAANDELNSAQEARKVAEARCVEAVKVVKAWSQEIDSMAALAAKADKADAADAVVAEKERAAHPEHHDEPPHVEARKPEHGGDEHRD